MSLTAALPRIEEHRVTVVFDCPKCRSKVRGTAYDLRETIRVAGAVPKWGWQSHWVRCSQCRSELKSTCQANQLQGASPATVNEHIISYHPLPNRVISIASLALSWTPIVGVVVGIIAIALTRRTRGWPRVVSLAGLVLALTLNAAMMMILLDRFTETASPLVQR